MLDLKLEDIDGILVRYNVALEILIQLFRSTRTKKDFSFIISFAEKIEMTIIKLQ